MSEGGKVSTARVVALGVTLVCVGALGFHHIPGMIAEDAGGTKWVNAVYCSIMTLTTVGFGDICPGDISGAGRTFIVILSFSGLGMFCGPIMDLAASWKHNLPMEGAVVLLSSTVATGIFLFSYLLEEMSESEAAYFSIITGTTIGYGDISPKSDAGKLAVALYALLAVNAVASLLEPAKDVLIEFCMVPPETRKNVGTTDKVVSTQAKSKNKKGKNKKKSGAKKADKQSTNDGDSGKNARKEASETKKGK
ncbi:Ion channel [Seminavis robusta]|uniref:Ion channel n=1 Tax=Seminavis robusta TaxID=568900 RepID=A0A9N8E1V5_9STRA|nr:Ion channel [Seminavis robusta]|eukprot:Sro461_g147720.1 Ion channel (251) ;mRNA; f:22119-23062